MEKTKKTKTQEPKVDERQARQQAFIKEMEELEKKHGLRVAVKLLYAESGIVPRIILIDKNEDAKEDGESTD